MGELVMFVYGHHYWTTQLFHIYYVDCHMSVGYYILHPPSSKKHCCLGGLQGIGFNFQMSLSGFCGYNLLIFFDFMMVTWPCF